MVSTHNRILIQITMEGINILNILVGLLIVHPRDDNSRFTDTCICLLSENSRKSSYYLIHLLLQLMFTSFGAVFAYGLHVTLNGILLCFSISAVFGTLYIDDLINRGLQLPVTSNNKLSICD